MHLQTFTHIYILLAAMICEAYPQEPQHPLRPSLVDRGVKNPYPSDTKSANPQHNPPDKLSPPIHQPIKRAITSLHPFAQGHFIFQQWQAILPGMPATPIFRELFNEIIRDVGRFATPGVWVPHWSLEYGDMYIAFESDTDFRLEEVAFFAGWILARGLYPAFFEARWFDYRFGRFTYSVTMGLLPTVAGAAR